MKNLIYALLAGSLALLHPAHAAVSISVVGDGTGYDIIGTEAAGYRTSSIAKSHDVDGDGAYGTAGYLVFGGSGTANGKEFPVNTVSSNPEFVTGFSADTANTVTHKNSSQVTYDDASLEIASNVADFGYGAILLANTGSGVGTWSELMTFTIDNTVTNFRLGIMGGQENNVNQQYDPTGYRVSFDGGTATEITGLPGVDDTIGMVFFDITTDGTAGTFSIEGQRRSSHASLAGLTFDVLSETPAGPPSITDFSATPAVVDAGDAVMLSWYVVGAEGLHIDQGVGVLATNSPISSGSTPVVVNVDTTYTLTATNVYGSRTAEAVVHLRQPVPNILIVVVDDMGTEDTSVDFNYDASGNRLAPVDPVSVGLDAWADNPVAEPGCNAHFRTPAMESLASRGMKFTRAYAQQVCSPSRCSLMTGMNSARHGTIQWLGRRNDFLHNIKMPGNPGLNATHRTLPEVFRDAGYRTIIAGKGHIGGNYTKAAGNYETPAADPGNDFYGFQINISASDGGAHGDCYSNGDTAFGLPASGSTAGLVAEYQDMTYYQLDPVTYTNGHPVANEPVFVTEAITREIIERIEDSVAEGLPFFAYLSEFAVHAPHDTDPRFTAHYPEFTDAANYLPLAYATMIEGMDKSLGDVLARLEELGVAEDTLVLFVSDNGSDSRPRGPDNPESPTLTGSNPLRGEKGMRYEGGIRVPLIISWAERNETNVFQQALSIPAGSREDDMVVIQDLFPTVLSVAGIAVPEVDDGGSEMIIDGRDLSAYLRGEAGAHRPQQLITHAPCSSRSSYFTTFHDENWKLMYNYTQSSPESSTHVPLGTYELYNLDADPHEAVNLASAQPERVMNMARAMVAELEELGAPYPKLRSEDADIGALGLPSAANDPHPVILPVLPAVDVDGDGLADNSEDPNRNGLQDVGETAADNADSDGDSTNDGGELALGLDPLDSGSYFYLNSGPPTNGIIELTWPSQPGTSFEIRGSTNLVDWGEMVVSEIPAADPGISTRYELPLSQEPYKFYRIGLK